MHLFDLLRSDGSIVINKKLAHEIGLNEAIIYSELISMYEYWKMHNRLTNDEWFYCTVENLEKNTTIKQKTQQRTIKKLEQLGLIQTKMLGVPAKRHFKITSKIYDLILHKSHDNQSGQNDHPRIDKMTELVWTNPPTNNTKDNTNKNINKTYNNKLDDDKRASSHNEENINSIIHHFKEQTKDYLTKRSFDSVVRKVIDKYNQGKIDSFRDYLATAITNKINELELRRAKEEIKEKVKGNKLMQPNDPDPEQYVRKIPFYNWLEN